MPPLHAHIDTDLGGDPDDACALAMLLGWPDVEIVGITTNLDAGGRRAGCVAYCLSLAGRRDIPVACGAGATLSKLEQFPSTWDDQRYWPKPVTPLPGPPGRALNLLRESIATGATVVALGAFTNLALLEVLEPGCLRGVPIFATAGWLGSPGAGFPQWGPDMDFNVCCDPRAAQLVWDAEPALALVAPIVSIKAHLRAADLPRLKASGLIGELLARQGQAVADQFGNIALGQAHAALPDDLLNFHWDPVTAAVAVGWPGCTLTEQRVTFDAEQPGFALATSGRAVRVVTDIDAPGFRELWLRRVEALP